MLRLNCKLSDILEMPEPCTPAKSESTHVPMEDDSGTDTSVNPSPEPPKTEESQVVLRQTASAIQLTNKYTKETKEVLEALSTVVEVKPLNA